MKAVIQSHFAGFLGRPGGDLFSKPATISSSCEMNSKESNCTDAYIYTHEIHRNSVNKKKQKYSKW